MARPPDKDAPLVLTRALGPLLLLTATFFLNFSARMILAPMMPVVEADLGIGHGQAGSLFLFMSLGYCAGMLTSGVVSSRLEHFRTIALSSIAVGAALFATSLTQAPWGFRAGLVLLGWAAGLYLPSGIATLTSLVKPQDWGKALACHELAPNAGFMLSPLLAEAFLRFVSWRGALSIMGVLAFVAGVAFLRFGKGGRFRGEAVSATALRALTAQRAFWILLVLFGLGLGASTGIYTMLPLYLTTGLGMTRGWANTLVALSRVSGILTIFGSGWLSDRLGPRRAMVAVLAAGGLSTLLLGLASKAWIAPFVLLQPTITAWFFPAGFAALSRIGPLAVALTVPVAMVIGGGVIPTLIGVLGERGAFAGGFSLVGLLMLGGVVLATRLDLGDRKPSSEAA